LTQQKSCLIIATVQKDAEMKLNAAQIAALAAGASQAEIDALATAPAVNPPGNPLAADPAAAPGADDAADPAAAPAAGAADPAAPPAADPASNPAPAAALDQTALVAHLQAQLTEKDAALIAAKVEAESFKAQAAAVDSLVTTLRTAIGEKLVALGGSADIAAGYTHTNIAAEYARIDGVFKKQFRVGGVAAVASPEDKDTKAELNPMLAEALKHSLIK
jgi:hypothetical protein